MADFSVTVSRRAMLKSLVALPATTALVSGAGRGSGRSGVVSLRYLGTAGWQIDDGRTTLLIDPYLSRINGPPPPGVPQYASPGDARPVYGWDDIATPDIESVDSKIKAADAVLVTHTHYDHVLDVPHIALKTGATVIGTESTQNVLRAYGVPEIQLITVRGGEDYEFGGFSVKVIPSLHSALDHKHYFSSATAPPGMKAPLTLRQIHPEGGTLAYLVRLNGHKILAFGSMNFIEDAIEGLRPDILIAGAGASRSEVYDYSARLMRSLSSPPLVLPTHWDNFLAPYGASQAKSISALQSFVAEIESVSPNSKVLIPDYFKTLTWP
jgi:L-ascorbate metabolism protein UlaG (beta-lactamase superfamily)